MTTLKKISALLLAAALTLSAAGCGGAAPGGSEGFGGGVKVQAANLLENYQAEPVAEKAADAAFIQSFYEMSAKLFQTVYSLEKEDKTMLISPLSLMTALSMTANGARGETLKEMEALLGSGRLSIDQINEYLHTYYEKLPSSDKAKFNAANGIWFKDVQDFTVEDDFLQKNVNYYQAAVRKAPFNETTVNEINDWVSLKTDKMIPSILNRLEESDRMVLVNALCFDAKWQEPFTNTGQQVYPFTNIRGGEDKADYMFGEVGTYLEDDIMTGFMKEYDNDAYRFVALLPKDEADFDAFVSQLDGERIGKLLDGRIQTKTMIKLPRFSFDYASSMKDSLKQLGMEKAFSVNQADFGGVSKDTPLMIGEVLHKTHIDLDHDGTRAAAVTAVIATYGSMIIDEVKEVLLDRPFVYMIVDTETMLPIFLGTVTGFDK